LAGGKTYHFRVKTVNSLGTIYGDDLTFSTTIGLPTLTTTSVLGVTQTSATSGGDITNDGGGAIIARDVCWGTSVNPPVTGEHTIDGTGTGSFISKMNCLSYGTTYYVRANATNSAGTAYGNQQSFTTDISPIIFNPNFTYGSVSDIDGNCYKTIQIGNQIWMAENLRTTKYNDGTPIPLVTDNTEWANLPCGESIVLNGYVTSGDAYCWYNNDAATYENDYGKLYNWGAVGTGKLCPTGWHVHAFDEWKIICYKRDYENGPYGEELMESDTTHWNESVIIDGTNETGFTGLPGGFRNATGAFSSIGQKGFYWSSSGGVYPC
jgi:uncharacterized protein (TIGR02145 family)